MLSFGKCNQKICDHITYIRTSEVYISKLFQCFEFSISNFALKSIFMFGFFHICGSRSKNKTKKDIWKIWQILNNFFYFYSHFESFFAIPDQVQVTKGWPWILLEKTSWILKWRKHLKLWKLRWIWSYTIFMFINENLVRVK